MESIWTAFFLTLIAGLSTGIGGAISVISKKTNTKFLSVCLGFSAGVMIYISFIEILPGAQASVIEAIGDKKGAAMSVAAFFAGMLIIGVIDRLIPKEKNPHEVKSIQTPYEEEKIRRGKLMRTGLLTALAVTIHNFPEGIAVFISAQQGASLAIPIVAAIALHNIPEGIAVSVPIYYATGSKRKAIIYSFLSGLAEPFGAVITYLILQPFMNAVADGMIFAGVAGIMVFISLDELLPSAREYGEHHLAILGMITGMAVMAVSLLIL